MKGWTFSKKVGENARRVLATSGYSVSLTKGSGVDPTQGHMGEVRSKWVVQTTTSLKLQHEHLFRELGLRRKNDSDAYWNDR